MYITYEEYQQIYDPVDEKAFNRLAVEACRVMDMHTTGIDNVRKLKLYFPTDDDAVAVKHCIAKVINLLHQIQEAEKSASMVRGYESTEQGMRGRVISAVSAGNESISYATSGNSAGTTIDAAVKDRSVRNTLISEIIREGLSGISDANGVNLLYMGRYPNVSRYHNPV